MSRENVRILVLDENKDRRQGLMQRLANFTDLQLEVPENVIDPSTYFINDDSEVVLVGSDYLGDGYGFSSAMLEAFPEKAVLLIDEEPSLDKMKQALIGGLSDVLSSEIENEALVEAILRSRLAKKQSLERLREDKTKTTQRSYGKIITIFSTKGGVGRTFVATNLAVLLANHSETKVALLDLDTEYGTAALAMGLQGKTTINDVLGDLKNLDGDLLDSYMLTHESGVKVLAAGEPQLENFINAEQIQIILQTLQDNYDFVIVDMPSRFMEMNSPAFTLATQLFMITSPEILALNNVKAGLGLLKDLNFPASRIRLVLNRWQRKGLSKNDVEKTLDANVFATIPEDAAVFNSLNLGTPLATSNPKGRTTKALQALVSSLIER